MELIDREALINELGERPYNWGDTDAEAQQVYDYDRFLEIVENAPTVDAVPVRHGRWIRRKDYYAERGIYVYKGDPNVFVCSECGEEINWKPYCGGCGADMREGSHEVRNMRQGVYQEREQPALLPWLCSAAQEKQR